MGQDAGTAKTLAFHKDVRTRCITLDGDDFNPAGTLTGGPQENPQNGEEHALTGGQ